MRRAAYDDSEAIKYIASNAGYVDYISENVSSMIRSGNLFVCVDGREMKGFFSLENIGQIWIGALRVHPGHRRSGVAMSMIKWAEEYTRNLSLRTMGALIEIHNVASINLFKSNGFVEKDRYFSIFGAPQVNNVRKYSKMDALPERLLLDWKVMSKSYYEEKLNNFEIVTDEGDNRYLKSENSFFCIENKSPIKTPDEGFTVLSSRLSIDRHIYENRSETYEFIYFAKTIDD